MIIWMCPHFYCLHCSSGLEIKIKELGGYGNNEMNRKGCCEWWKEKYQYYIKEKKNAAVVRHVMPSARKKLYLWWKTKKALNIHR